jgi:N6-L-threonylcarbamoyladenine synthase
MTTILAIETSCDETAVAIVKNRHIYSNIVASQIELHQTYGGVVPEVASRLHLETINFCIDRAFKEAQLDWSAIDGVAATVAPGLVGALMVGVSAAKTLAMLHQKPFVGVHHLEGHIYATYLNEPQLQPPFLCLLVSGGHTSLIYVKDCGVYEMLGSTRDDAAGGYPGGPAIDRAAKMGNPMFFTLPEGKVSLPEGGYHPYDSSFSGLKTAVLRLVKQLESEKGKSLPIADLAASFQETVARSLVKRTVACALDYDISTVVAAGGVAANSALRQYLQEAAEKHNLKVQYPALNLCTDNAAMIACAAADHLSRGHQSSLTLNVSSRMAIADAMQLYQGAI